MLRQWRRSGVFIVNFERISHLVVVFLVFLLFLYSAIWRRSGVFTVNFKNISHLVLVFLLLTLNM